MLATSYQAVAGIPVIKKIVKQQTGRYNHGTTGGTVLIVEREFLVEMQCHDGGFLRLSVLGVSLIELNQHIVQISANDVQILLIHW